MKPAWLRRDVSLEFVVLPLLLTYPRVYNPHLRQESDEALLKKAKLQAMGIDVSEKPQRRNNDRPEMATDEVVSYSILPDICSDILVGDGKIQEEDEEMRFDRYT